MTFHMKHPRFKSQKLRESAKHPDATCANCDIGNGPDEIRLVLAHRNIPGEFGTGLKNDDYCAAILCSVPNAFSKTGCHGYFDGEGRNNAEEWERFQHRTWRFWFDYGFLKVV